MENAVDALHIGFAMLVFVIAVSLAFTVFSQAREVADVVLYLNDRTNFEEHVQQVSDSRVKHGERVVGMETIIPAIRRFVHENDGYWIEVIAGSDKYIFDIDQLKNQGIIIDSQLQKYTSENINTILSKYAGRYFIEKYSEYEYSGGFYDINDPTSSTLSKGQGRQTRNNGETVEAVNTETKVKITYEII